MATRTAKRLLAEFPHFRYGIGAAEHVPGYCAIALNYDTAYDCPGPREVVDRTGIAAGYRVYKEINHADVPWLLTYNGTNTRIYRLNAGVWQQRLEVATAQGVDIVSAFGVVAVGYGSSRAYDFSSDSGATWTASTQTGSARYFTRAIFQSGHLTNPRVFYVVDPDLAFFTRDLTNTGTPSTSMTIGDNQTAQDSFRSLREDDNGVLICGKRRALFAPQADGSVIKLTPDYMDTTTDAGGQGDRPNFEAFTEIEGRAYYVVEGYEIIEYFHGQINEAIAPHHNGPKIPRLHLPVNALTSAGEWLVVALGSANTATLKNVANAPGGASRLANSFGTTSELYKGRYQPDPKTGQLGMTWHGCILQCTDLLRFAWWHEDDSFLYLSSGDSELINEQQRRCYFLILPPQFHQADASAVILNAGAATVECLGIGFGDDFSIVRLLEARAHTLGLAATAPSLRVDYRPFPDYETTAYRTAVTWNDNYHPPDGVRFPHFTTCRKTDLQFVMTGTGNLYAMLGPVEVEAEPYLPEGVRRG